MSKHNILLSLRNLYPHCKHYMSRDPSQVQAFLTGYLGVLERGLGSLDAEGPAIWVDRVCTNWLDRLQDRGQKFPTPDEVRDLAKVYMPTEEKVENGPWHEITKGEYEALKLTDKVRYLTILADKFGGQAGPMYPKGKGEGCVFPERHAKYKPMEARCRAEVTRLQTIIARKKAETISSQQLGGGGFTRFLNKMPFGDAA